METILMIAAGVALAPIILGVGLFLLWLIPALLIVAFGEFLAAPKKS